ncbi:substrate-binding domain-containing protein [Streptomyces sp. S1D4-11]|nr:LacI family transcriptional regulator [Streptomyces sp. S1D4-11]
MALPDHASPLLEVRRCLARQTVTTLGLPPPASFVVPRPRTAATGAAKAFLAAHGTVTAVAAFADDIALRTLTALHDLGRAAPDDLAVIGLDDTEYGALVTPALTTVHIDAEAHGRLAARTALGLGLAGLSPEPGQIIARDSA